MPATSGTAILTLPSDTEILMVREFDAPKHLVYKSYTTPELADGPHTFTVAATDAVGSNNFAVAGSLSDSGAAMLANDMHLGLTLPSIWYRLTLEVPDRINELILDFLAGQQSSV